MPSGKILWWDKRDGQGIIEANGIEYYFDSSVVSNGEPKSGLMAWFDVNLKLITHTRCAYNVHIKPTFMQTIFRSTPDLIDTMYFLGQEFPVTYYPDGDKPIKLKAEIEHLLNILDSHTVYELSFNIPDKTITLKVPAKNRAYKIGFRTQAVLKKFKTLFFRSKTILRFKEKKNKAGGKWVEAKFGKYTLTNQFGSYWSAVENGIIQLDHPDLEILVGHLKSGITYEPYRLKYLAPEPGEQAQTQIRPQ